MEHPQDRILVVAPYQAGAPAAAEFENLVALFRGRKVHSEGVILVSHDESGAVCVHHTADHTRFTFAGDVENVSTTLIPRIYGRSYAIEAELQVPEGGAEGVICAFADFIGGFALWMDEQRRLIHTYQYLGIDTYKQMSTETIPAGDVTVKMLFEADEAHPGTGGTVTLWANGRKIGEGRIPKTVSLLYTTYAAMAGVGHGAAG